jgi:hypothetical protein
MRAGCVQVVDASGLPTAFATLADHLHGTEPANLAFLALLESGALHDLCKVSPHSQSA